MATSWTAVSRPQLLLGSTVVGDVAELVALDASGVSRHKRLLGVSGSGKSKLLVSMFIQLFNQGIGVALLDPHSDLCFDIMQFLADTGYFDHPDAYRRLLYIDFSRQDRFLPMNWLRQPYPDHVVARNLVEVWKRAWSSLEGGAAPQLENIVLAATLVLVQQQHPLTDLGQLLTDKPFRDGLLAGVSDSEVVRFFRTRFDRSGKGVPASAESTLRRAFLLSFSPTLRQTLGQTENRLDFRHLMDTGTSVLVNLSGLDAETQRFLGCLITVGFEQAALSRADQPEPWRRPYHLMLDEYSLFAAQSDASLARILDLARKYKLTLTLAHQTAGQTGPQLRAALQNAVDITMRVGHEDAQALAPHLLEYDPLLTNVRPDPNDPYRSRASYVSAAEQQASLARTLERLPAREALVRIDGRTRRLRTLTVPPARRPPHELDAIVERYAQLLLTPTDQLDQYQHEGQHDVGMPGTDEHQPSGPASESAPDTDLTIASEVMPTAPAASASELTEDELAFLTLVATSPGQTISQLYDGFGASVWKASKLRDALVERGYLVLIETRLGQGRRVAKFLIPTSKTVELVSATMPAGRGGPIHRHVQQLIAGEAMSKGYQATVEWQLADGGIVDVHLAREAEMVAVEVAISSRVGRELEHIAACLRTGYGRIICLVASDALRAAIARDLPRSFTADECQRVTLAPLSHLGRLL